MAQLLLLAALAAPPNAAEVPEAILRYNAPGEVFRPARIDSLLVAEQEAPTSDRIAAWARRYLAAEGIGYRFGLAEGGYARDGLLVKDRHQDCVSLVYRCTELARARDRRDALAWALHTRFAGIPLEAVADSSGCVDYDRPEHLDFSLDMIRSGHWGVDVTMNLTGVQADSSGTSRYPAGSFSYVPTARIDIRELRAGDIVWLVLNPANPAGANSRRRYGTAIGHLGILLDDEQQIWLVHAASRPLPGWYEEGGVVRVPLLTYLSRVEKFAGIIITRFEQSCRRTG